METKQTIIVTANPAPLGLLSFGMTTILLNLHNAGLFENNSAIMGMGIFVGGLAQIFAGLQEFKKNNTFGATAFTAYGAFWIALVTLWLLPALDLAQAPTKEAMGWFLVVWGLFSTGMLVAAFKLSRMLQLIFITLVPLFALLAIADFTHNPTITKIAGYEGIVCGGLALYASVAAVINETHGRKVLPA